MDQFAGGVGLIPEQDWETPDLRAVAVRDTARRSPRSASRTASRRARRPAQLVGRVVRPALRRHRRRPPRRPAAEHLPPLRRAHAGHDAAHGHEPGRPERRQRLAGHRHRHDGARQHGLRHRDEHGHELRDDERLDDGRRGRRVQRRRRRDGRDDACSTSSPSSPSGGTAHAKRTVVFDFVPGTLLLDVTDPSGDDNGPGQLRLPDVRQLPAGRLRHPGVPGLRRRHERRSSGVKTRDLSPTFGSPLGAQLVDVYVHDPAPRRARPRRPPSNASRNFQIAPADAWSRLIQVQGFGQRYVDAARHDARHGRDQRQPDLALHHLQRPEGDASARPGRVGRSRSC